MRSKSRENIRNRWETFCFVLTVGLLAGKFQVSRCFENDKPGLPGFQTDGGVRSNGKVEEVQKVEKSALEPTEIKSFTRPWVPKCCNLTYGFTFENKSLCVETKDEFLPDFEDRPDYSETAKDLPVKTRFEYFIGDPCLEGKYILDLTAYPDDKYSVYTNGTLLYLDQLFRKEEFCLETLNGTIRAFVCFGAGKPDFELNFTYVVYATGLLISIPFLLATALTYCCIDLFRDLRGKSLSCHVLCLAIGYLALAVVQLATDQLDETLCIAAGFIIQFFFVAAFFWLNVISYDTWRCIKNDFRCVPRRMNPPSEKIIFCLYSLYGWYGPIIISIVSLIMDFEPAIPESFVKPNFGLRSCWFNSDDAALPYFYGPVAVMILINIVLFFMTARKIYSEQKRREEEMKTRNRNSREEHLSISVYIKTLQECIYLFCIMGLNWAAEVISWVIGGSQIIWLITDIFNALQGILIFCLFVLKPKRVRKEIKRRLNLIWKRITKCDCHYQKETTYSQSEAMEDFCYENELDKFLSQPNTTAV